MQIYGDLLGFYGFLKRLLALGVWKRKCKRPHKLDTLNHSVYQYMRLGKQTFIYV